MQLSVATLGLGFILCTAARSQTSYINNIKNVVVLVQENRSFDTLAGGFTYNATIDGLVNHTYCNPADTLRSTSSNFFFARPIQQKTLSQSPPIILLQGAICKFSANIIRLPMRTRL
jgi:hypothetical protein